MKKDGKENWLMRHLGWLIPIPAVIAGITAYKVIKIYTDHFPGTYATEQGTWGEFGDYFGGILNPIFSFLALIALLFTLYVQRYGLKKEEERFKLLKEIQLITEVIRYKQEFIKTNLEQFKNFSNLADENPEITEYKEAANIYLNIYKVEYKYQYFYSKRIESHLLETVDSETYKKLIELIITSAELHEELEVIMSKIKKK
jgi:uncharacterized membrane protein